MHNVTNTVLNTFYSYGYLPALDSGALPGDLLISTEIGGGVLSFHCSAATDTVSYQLAFRHAEELHKEDLIQLYRIFRTECPACFGSVEQDRTAGALSLKGHRPRNEITVAFLECVIEEAVSLHTVFKIRELLGGESSN